MAGLKWNLIVCSSENAYLFLMKPAIDPKLLKNPIFQRLMAEGLAIQDRFAAEPIYAKTGKGYLKSAGVEELKKIKEAQKKKQR